MSSDKDRPPAGDPWRSGALAILPGMYWGMDESGWLVLEFDGEDWLRRREEWTAVVRLTLPPLEREADVNKLDEWLKAGGEGSMAREAAFEVLLPPEIRCRLKVGSQHAYFGAGATSSAAFDEAVSVFDQCESRVC